MSGRCVVLRGRTVRQNGRHEQYQRRNEVRSGRHRRNVNERALVAPARMQKSRSQVESV
jgi:hypothetical protein